MEIGVRGCLIGGEFDSIHAGTRMWHTRSDGILAHGCAGRHSQGVSVADILDIVLARRDAETITFSAKVVLRSFSNGVCGGAEIWWPFWPSVELIPEEKFVG